MEGALKSGFLPRDSESESQQSDMSSSITSSISNIIVSDNCSDGLGKQGKTSMEDKSCPAVLDTDDQTENTNLLPKEMIQYIFSFLDPSSIKSVACVSR